jgi:serine/threonine protein kinase
MSGDWVNQAVLNQQTWRYRKRVSRPYAGLFEQDVGALNEELTNSADPLKDDRTTTVQRISRGDDQFILKRYNARNLWHRFKRAFRRSRASRCWDMSECFRRAGLSVAEPICMLEKRFGPICQDAYFITRFIPGEELLDLLPALNNQQQRQIAREIENAFSIMRDYQLSHGDLKATNLLWYNEKIFFVDLDAAKRHNNHRNWQRAHRKDRKRFLKNWREQPEILALFSEL